MHQGTRRHHTTERPALQAFLERLLTHSRLGLGEQHVIASLPATLVSVAAHRDVVRLGEIVDHACLVERGLVGRFGQTADGARQFVSLHVPGEMVDLFSLMAPPATAAIAALTPTTVLQVPHAALREVTAQFPAISVAFWRDCVLQAARVTQWLVNVGRRDARSRMAHFLCEMALRLGKVPGQHAIRYELPVTQEQLADILGLTSVHVNRTLMTMRKEQLVSLARGCVEIMDWEALTATADFDTSYLLPKLPSLSGPRAE
jgi:CRP-like cAMP-binding protein